MAITGDQLRMARAALRLTSREVAEITGVDKGTIIRAEFRGQPYYRTVAALQAAYEARGIKFLEPVENDHGPGVALKWGG